MDEQPANGESKKANGVNGSTPAAETEKEEEKPREAAAEA